jgi:phosphoglycerol transferase
MNDVEVGSPAPWSFSQTVILTFLVTAVLFLRSAWIENATNFGDECYYSALSNRCIDQDLLLPRTGEPSFLLPNFLYFRLVSFHGYFGASGPVLVKLFNSLIFSLSLFPILSLAGKVGLGRKSALAVGLVSILLPANTYTAYFMPEPFYYTMFWVLVWYLVGQGASQRPVALLTAGLLLAVLFGIKPHAICVLPAVLGTFAAEAALPDEVGLRSRLRVFLGQSLILIVGFVASLIALRLLCPLPYSMPPEYDTTFKSYLGFYSSASTNKLQASFAYVRKLADFGRIHLAVLLPLFGLPLLVAAGTLLVRPKGQVDFARRRLSLLLLFFLGIILPVIANFSASVNHNGRIHQRLYDFLFPGFLLVFFGGAPVLSASWKRVAFAAAGLACGAYALWTPLSKFDPIVRPTSFVDAPLLSGILNYKLETVWYVAVGAVMALALFVLYDGRIRRRSYLAVLTTLLAVADVSGFLELSRKSKEMGTFRRKADLVSSLVPEGERSSGMVIGADFGSLTAFLFHFRAVPFTRVMAGELDLASLPPNVKWVFLLYNQPIRGPYRLVVQGNIGTFVRIDDAPVQDRLYWAGPQP